MNFLQQLRQLNFNDIGRWPFVFHAFFVGIFFAIVAIEVMSLALKYI